jgi:hypothetical protein
VARYGASVLCYCVMTVQPARWCMHKSSHDQSDTTSTLHAHLLACQPGGGPQPYSSADTWAHQQLRVAQVSDFPPLLLGATFRSQRLSCRH